MFSLFRKMNECLMSFFVWEGFVIKSRIYENFDSCFSGNFDIKMNFTKALQSCINVNADHTWKELECDLNDSKSNPREISRAKCRPANFEKWIPWNESCSKSERVDRYSGEFHSLIHSPILIFNPDALKFSSCFPFFLSPLDVCQKLWNIFSAASKTAIKNLNFMHSRIRRAIK